MSSIINKVTALRDYLNGVQTLDSAEAFIAGDTIHAWEILKNRPGTCKIAVGFESCIARSTFPGGDITGRSNQYLYAIISRGRGLQMTRSDNLIVGSGDGLPLFQLAEMMRDLMRAIRFDQTTDEVPDYVSLTDWGKELQMNVNFNIDAFICRIWVGTQLAQPQTQQQNQQIPI